jgi:hypothetical protein
VRSVLQPLLEHQYGPPCAKLAGFFLVGVPYTAAAGDALKH